MKLLNVTLDSPEQNLALDEALLLCMEHAPSRSETLRVWEPQSLHVVLGRASKAELEANLPQCHADGIPVLRRTTGGATILAGPGCLFYSVVLSRQQHPELGPLDAIHHYVLERISHGLSATGPTVTPQGTSDLTIKDSEALVRKVSGNSLRVRRQAILYHGTLLYDFPLAQIPLYLGTPPRQPDYRDGRSHTDFVTNLPTDATSIKKALVRVWNATETTQDWPESSVQQLVETKYSRNDWNLRL